jgi:transcriptional regulator with XRE-family HTH domain
MARKRHAPISDDDREIIGAMLRDLRRSAGFRSVEAAAGMTGSPAARQTIYAYERGELTPSLPQFLELVEFYVLGGKRSGAIPAAELRTRGVAAVTRALQLPAYHVARAWELVARMMPDPREGT